MDTILQLNFSFVASSVTLLLVAIYYLFLREDSMLYTKIIDKQGTRVARLNPRDEIHTRNVELTIIDQLLDNAKQEPNVKFLGSHQKPSEPYSWVTYKEFVDDVKEMGSGLQSLFNFLEEPQNVGIFGINCYEWLLAQFSLSFYSNIPVPLYDTLGSSSISYVINLTKLKVCFCFDETKVQTLLKNRENYPFLTNFIIMHRKMDDAAWKMITDKHPDCKFFNYDDVRSAGRMSPLDFKKPSQTDLYLINFTSGSTGNPKGVIITHEMVMKTIASVYLMEQFNNFPPTTSSKQDPRFIYMKKGDIYFSFLPLAHILEQMLIAISIYSRASVGFYSGHIPSLLEDIKTLGPTLVVFVPRILSRIYQKALENVSGSAVKRAIFHGSIAAKTRLTKMGLKPLARLIQRIIFGKLNAMLGGNIRVVITGSAPCPPKIAKFIRSALNVTFHVGYGASETCGPVTVTYCIDNDNHSVGVPICCSAILLKDIPQMDIIVARDGCGEICIKGPNCTPGYYLNEEQTKELIDDDGWLHTGDVGSWDEKGRLVIVDRCKNLFKLSQGEYISPEKLENAYQLSPVIEQIFVDGDSTKNNIIALVVPNPVEFKKAAKEKLQTEEFEADIESKYGDERLKKIIIEELEQIALKQDFNKLEQTKSIMLLKDQFTLEDGLLTPTLKFIRNKIRTKYADQIKSLYKE